ncbi:uncharacterized protein J4E88_005001 [Alternaria novae-zelandiae]|uniref:uncharacterized protein n=1 Tax=Alternaria novae-zelandiae TaxID=430562 RepID=UPI0020C5215B|nr:uncharacterized protein J4E88_005001 [Alternaria novae-zelandiae]KAI4682113.1 hypothetical protein J4E88_005001 [Alternaria novae-zelandiae]
MRSLSTESNHFHVHRINRGGSQNPARPIIPIQRNPPRSGTSHTVYLSSDRSQRYSNLTSWLCKMTQQDPAVRNPESKQASVDAQDPTTEKNPSKFQKGPRFWAIMVVLSLVSLLTALEATVTSTVMPSLVADLGGGEEFIWVSNAYFLTM